jgi:hypothetical protein
MSSLIDSIGGPSLDWRAVLKLTSRAVKIKIADGVERGI